MDRDIDEIRESPLDRDRSDDAAPQREAKLESREQFPIAGPVYAYCLSEAEIRTMIDIGRFRTIDKRDLAKYRYQDNHDHLQDDWRSLRDQGLVQQKTIWTGKQAERLTVLVLTKRGKLFVERQNNTSEQKMFSGFVKPAEIRHDAAIYRMYQVEAAKIERAGGRVKRVVLDYELKQKVYRPLAKTRAQFAPTLPEYQRRQADIARLNQLRVVQGKILLPDLRIEFERSNGEQAHVDLELATHHYRGSSLRAKSEAGFKMYAPEGCAAGLASAFDPEHVVQIFSF